MALCERHLGRIKSEPPAPAPWRSDLREEYAPRNLVLWGHSWGGALGTAYLLDDRRQRKIDAWIEVDGAHDSKRGFALSREWVMDHAREQIRAGDDAEFWEEALAFYRSNEVIGMEQLAEHGRWLTASEAYVHGEPESVDIVGSAMFGPMSGVYFSNTNHIWKHMDWTSIDLTSDMHRIQLPSLVLWGASDGVLPVPLASETLDHLGAEDERLRVFEASGHSPMAEQPAAFATEVEAFLGDVL